MIRAKVNIETAKRAYKPGEVVAEVLSKADMAFLRKHGFIEEDEEAVQAALDEDKFSDEAEDVFEDRENSVVGIEYKDESSLKKMNKEEIVAYASKIGLELDVNALKADLVDAVLNYVEEKMAE